MIANSKNMLTGSIPVTSLRNQIIAGSVIGFSVFFILVVFQPFGTFTFQMKNKTLFLAGYGVICTAVYSGYYTLTMKFLKRWFIPTKWNILKEAVTLVIALMAMSLASLFYHHEIVGGYDIHLKDILYFFRISLAIGIVPLVIIYYSKWIKSRLITIETLDNTDGCTITFESNNKKEKPITVKLDELIYVKSNGNYIEIARKNTSGTKTHLIRNSLNQVESKLSEKLFLKIHRSYIVNVALISDLCLRGSSYFVKVRGTDIQLPVSRSMVKTVREATN